MTKVTFFRQKRADGGVRTGISVDDDTVLWSFGGSRGDYDPALLWYVDVRCEGKLPAAPEAARDWLLAHAGVIEAGLEELAERLQAGLDIEAWPVLHPAKNSPKGVRITVACSAVRMPETRDIARVICGVARGFERHVTGLKAAEPVGR